MHPELPEPEIVKSLLEKAGIAGDYEISHFQSGGNNSIFKIRAGDHEYALKKYSADERKRLETEWNFLSCLNENISDAMVPKNLAADIENNIALYDFIKGRKLVPSEIKDDEMRQIYQFIKNINSEKIFEAGKDLAPAAEAEFSAQGHLAVLESRMTRIEKFSADELSFFLAELRKTKDDLVSLIEDLLPDDFLLSNLRCLSPSDFGFHNVLADNNGKLTFIDFEYAGWDDPAKLSADFFFQPDIPVDDKYYESFLKAALHYMPEINKKFQMRRVKILKPLFGLRWCCIMLNPFNSQWAARRDLKGDLDKIKAERLSSAHACLTRTKDLVSQLKGLSDG